jgi:hypothetical protein
MPQMRSGGCAYLLVALGAAVARHPTSTPAISPLPPIPLSWSATIWNNCSWDFPFCPSSTPFTELVAQDAPGFKSRQGPISLLPKDENQLLIHRFDLGFQYLLWVDATAPVPTVLNCTRAAVEVPSNKTSWERGFIGNLYRASFNRTTARRGKVYEYNTTFGAGCPYGPPPHSYTGHEGQAWTLAARDSSNYTVQSFTNDIHYPPAMPKNCSGGVHMWWHQCAVQPTCNCMKRRKASCWCDDHACSHSHFSDCSVRTQGLVGRTL